MKRVLIVFILLGLLTVAALQAVMRGVPGRLEAPGRVAETPRPTAQIAERAASMESSALAIGVESPRQILFGDLHVHTTYSMDAFLTSLPIMQGEGAHPPADACDAARFCAGLDFYSINDHAEGLTPSMWRDIRESVRQCNAVADPASPDLVAFLGWEWTQMGDTPSSHYGHKNVVLRDSEPSRTPARPIAAAGNAWEAMRTPVRRPLFGLALRDFTRRQRYFDLLALQNAVADVPICPTGVGVRELPDDCSEVAATPRELFARLDEWGFPSIVIPHGNAWGNTTPAEIDWEKQLADGNHDPQRQTLIEVYSGHGSSEAYRSWRHVGRDGTGAPVCPESGPGFVPECRRAGELVRARCLASGEGADECDRRAALAQRHFVDAGRAGSLTVPGAEADDWLDAGQCADCFQPAFQYRPGGSSQYALTLSGAGVPGAPDDPRWRFRFGLIASSDNHTARPATGYKEFSALGMTDALHADGSAELRSLLPIDRTPRAESIALDPRKVPLLPGGDERLTSFFYTGGLVAVHADGRSRDGIWRALERKEVYGTSGPRILLWFDLLNAPGGQLVPMGGEVSMQVPPRFRVRAVGSRVQRPGCPDGALEGLGAERLAALCMGECHNPGDERRRVERIEVVRIRPRVDRAEDVGPLIEDPWRTFACPADGAGCAIEFEDASFVSAARDTVYYVRAIEEAASLVNGDPLRCERDADGRCLESRPCRPGGAGADDCTSEAQPRAWSSPIFVDLAIAAVD